MAHVLAEYGEVVAARAGIAFRARACALPTRSGLWKGWIEFNPTNGDPTFRSPQETMQSSRTGVMNWAINMTPNELDLALDRALGRLGYSLGR